MTFDPDWTIAPGETLRAWREENHLGARAAATACGRIPLPTYEALEAGRRPVTSMWARRLAQGTGIPARLWLNLERAYRAGLAAGKTDTTGRPAPLDEIRELCDRRGWDLHHSAGTQREPENCVSIRLGRVWIRATSLDGVDRAAGDMRAALVDLGAL